jgi:hypothetical protein
MPVASLSLREGYWEAFSPQDEDLNYLYNRLIELETPLTSQELTRLIVEERVRREVQALENRLPSEGKLFAPKDHYEVGDTLIFPALNWKKGKIIQKRQGNNPELPPFEVIEVEFEKDGKRQYASGVEEHVLNQPIQVNTADPNLDPDKVMQDYGPELVGKVEKLLENNPDIVRIAGRWFPRALLVDINIGHLNLAEAVLDMAGGGPLPTHSLVEQIELPTDVNPKLTEFSLNLALQEDERFDEVGPAGEVLWFLKRLEPASIQNAPVYLRYTSYNYDPAILTSEMKALERDLDDELSQLPAPQENTNDIVVDLIYPHWRTGTLPLSERVKRLFPTAYETPRIQFTLVDGDTGSNYSAWVVRPYRYVFGLRDWYQSQGLIPGSQVHIQRGKKPGEVIVHIEKRRSTREWIRTVLVGADGGIVYAMLKQVVTATFDERMAIAVPDMVAIDSVWERTGKARPPFEVVVTDTMRELAKLNPQGHVHAQELYAAVNVVRRSPPGPIFSLMVNNPAFIHVGDLYYRLEESSETERAS